MTSGRGRQQEPNRGREEPVQAPGRVQAFPAPRPLVHALNVLLHGVGPSGAACRQSVSARGHVGEPGLEKEGLSCLRSSTKPPRLGGRGAPGRNDGAEQVRRLVTQHLITASQSSSSPCDGASTASTCPTLASCCRRAKPSSGPQGPGSRQDGEAAEAQLQLGDTASRSGTRAPACSPSPSPMGPSRFACRPVGRRSCPWPMYRSVAASWPTRHPLP